MVLPKKFCCCCNLQTGGVILGWGGIVMSIAALSVASIIMAHMNAHISSLEDGVKKIAPTAVYNFLACQLVVTIIALIAFIFLLFGAQMKKPMLLVPWLIGQMIAIVVGSLGTIIACIALFTMIFTGGAGFLVFLFGISFNGVNLYWWLCMLSLFKKWRKEENNVAAVDTPRTPAPGISLHVNHVMPPSHSVSSGMPPLYSVSSGMPPSYDISSGITSSFNVPSQMPASHGVSSKNPTSHVQATYYKV